MVVLALVGLLGVGCGASAAESGDGDEGETLATDGSALLVEVGASLTEALARPSRSIEELEGVRRAARGTDRRIAERDLARAHLFAAEETTGRERRAHFRAVQELTGGARVRDASLAAELDLIGLWGAWRSGARTADGRAQRFADQHEEARDLVLLAWLVRGEIAFARERWDDALAAFRAPLGRLGHPLYAYALYRSAHVMRAQGREDDMRQALAEVRDLGCARDASASTIRVSLEATRALGEAVRRVDDRDRPERCATAAPAIAAGGEEERPPGQR